MKVLAATDFSEESLSALDFAAEIVRKCGGKMYILHIVNPCLLNTASCTMPDDVLGGFTASPITPPNEYDLPTLLDVADARAKELGREISRKHGVPIYAKAEEDDSVVESVHGFCKRHHINLLVVSNRHHSLLGSLLLGNTAEKLMRTAQIPITIVPCDSPKA